MQKSNGRVRDGGEAGAFSPQAGTKKIGRKVNRPEEPGEGGLGHCFGEEAAPWYTGDFEAAWRDVPAGCQGLLRRAARVENGQIRWTHGRHMESARRSDANIPGIAVIPGIRFARRRQGAFPAGGHVI